MMKVEKMQKMQKILLRMMCLEEDNTDWFKSRENM